MKFWLPALLAMAVPAAAHHPFTPFYDASKPASITGVVVELRTVNPHVVLIIEATGPDGTTGRWAFEGIPPNAFRRLQKDYEARLKPGTKITISGWPAKDPTSRVFSGRQVTFADGSTMGFGPTPEEADKWRCSSGPRDQRQPVPESECAGLYRYPDVRPQ